jgi:uncharacterized protein (DUF697 family)
LIKNPYTVSVANLELQPYNPEVTVLELIGDEHERARGVTERSSLWCAAVSIEPIPWLDLAVQLPIQLRMVMEIGKIYGFEMNSARAHKVLLELTGVVAYSYVTRHVARGFLKFMPVVGGLLNAPITYAGTYALGHVAERYFRAKREDLPPLSSDERREWLTSLTNEGKRIARNLRPEDFKRALEMLGKMRRKVN